MQGLADSMVAEQGAGQMPTVEEVIALLMEGVPPEELEKQGIPQELIMQAIQIIEQQMSAQQTQDPQPQMGGGLAQQSLV